MATTGHDEADYQPTPGRSSLSALGEVAGREFVHEVLNPLSGVTRVFDKALKAADDQGKLNAQLREEERRASLRMCQCFDCGEALGCFEYIPDDEPRCPSCLAHAGMSWGD